MTKYALLGVALLATTLVSHVHAQPPSSTIGMTARRRVDQVFSCEAWAAHLGTGSGDTRTTTDLSCLEPKHLLTFGWLFLCLVSDENRHQTPDPQPVVRLTATSALRPQPERVILLDRLQRDRSRQATRIRVLTRRQPSSTACHSRLKLRQTSLGHLS